MRGSATSASPAASAASGARTTSADAGIAAAGSRRTCARTRQPAAANACDAARPKRPLAPRTRTVREVVEFICFIRGCVERFDWSLVRSFLAVLDAGSVTAAAKQLGATQPTLSRHVAELEAELGAPLFERTGRGVTPTAAALAIADAARQMADGALALTRGLAGARSPSRGVVRVTTSQVAATWLLPAVLARLQRAHPEIEIELVASNELTNLLRREADIAV